MRLRLINISHPSGKLFDAFCHFVDNHPEGSFFQSASFIDLIDRWPEAEWVLLLAQKEEGMKDPGAFCTKSIKTRLTRDPQKNISSQENIESYSTSVAGSLLAVIIRESAPNSLLLRPFRKQYRLLTARTLIYGGPLMAPGTRLQQELIIRLLLEGLNERIKKISLFTQFRNSYDPNNLTPLYREMGYTWHDRLNLLVDTSSTEKAWGSLSNNRRRQVRLSLENGAEIISEPTINQMNGFYEILNNLYKHKIKKPLPGHEFFLALYKTSQKRIKTNGTERGETHSPVVKYFIASISGRVIGGSVCVMMPGKRMHEWYACGLDRELRNQRVYPSVLSTWAAIEYAAGNNIPTFDFMGMGKPDIPYGVRDFKKEFGGDWINPGRFFKINRRVLYSITEIGYNIKYLFKR